MQLLRRPLLSTTVNDQQIKCSHHGILEIHRNRCDTTLKTYALAKRKIRHNLRSVHDLDSRYGLVSFKENEEYIFNTNLKPPKPVDTAPWTGQHYQLTTRIASLPAPTQGTRKVQPSTPTPQHKHKPNSPSPPEHTLPITRANQHHTSHSQPLSTLHNPVHTRKNSWKYIQTQNRHTTLNHAHPATLAITAKQRHIPTMPKSLPFDRFITFTACSTAEMHPAPHPSTTHNYHPGAYVSSDTCGLIKPTSKHGSNYMLLIICAASHFAIAHFAKNRKHIPQHIDQLYIT